MRYRLKDKELQQKLDELSDGDFSKQLALNYKRICSDLEFLMQITLWFCKSEGPLHALEITPDMLEEVREYDPHGWNDFPEVEPPEGVLMRVEWREGVELRRGVARYVAWGDNKEFVWMGERGIIIRQVDRFRPWDEEDKE